MAFQHNGKIYLTPEDVRRLDLELENADLQWQLCRQEQQTKELQRVVDQSIAYLEKGGKA